MKQVAASVLGACALLSLGCDATGYMRPATPDGGRIPSVAACDDPTDSDGDGIADALDDPALGADSDGDGLSDAEEAGSSGNPCAPATPTATACPTTATPTPTTTGSPTTRRSRSAPIRATSTPTATA